MPIDPSIAMGFQMPRQQSPLDMAAQVMALRNAMTQNQLYKMQADERRNAISESAGIRNVLSSLGPQASEEQVLNALRSQGTKTALDYADVIQNRRITMAQHEAQTRQANAALLNNIVKINEREWGAVSQDPTPQRFLQALENVERGYKSAGIDANFSVDRNSIATMTPDQIMKVALGRSTAIEHLKPMIKQIDQGDKKIVAGFDPYTGQQIGAPQEFKVGMSPSVEATRRGQDITAETARRRHDIAVENAAIARDAAAEKDRQSKIDKADQKAADTLKREVTKYSNTLQKNSIPEFEEALSTLENRLENYAPGQTPGVGRGVGLVPDWLQGQEAEFVRQDIAAIKNIVLKARSGSAVSESELRRLVEEFGIGGFRSEASVRNAVKNIRSRFESVKENAAAGVSDDVKDAYEAGGGMRIERGGSQDRPSFKSDEEAAAARKAGKIKHGDKIKVNGKSATWKD